MEQLWICRICMAGDARMHLIANTHLQAIYESLTSMPLETDDNRPIFACYICYARLQNTYQLKKTCLWSESMLTQMLSSPLMIPKDRPTGRRLEIIHPVIRLSLPGAVQNNAVPKSSVKKNVVPNNLIPDNVVPENEDQDNELTILDVPELYVDIKVEHEDFEDDIVLANNDAQKGNVSPSTSTDNISKDVEKTKKDEDLLLVKNVVPVDVVADSQPEQEKTAHVDTIAEDNVQADIVLPSTSADKTAHVYAEEDILLVKNVVPVDVVADSQPEQEKTAHVDTIAEDNVQADIVLPSTSADKTAHVYAEEDLLLTENDGQTDNIPALTSANKTSKKELKVVLERVTLDNIHYKSDVEYIKSISDNTEGTPKSSAKKAKNTNETIKIHVTKSIIKQPNSIIETPIKKKVRFSDIIEENVTNPTIQIGLPPKKPKPFTCDICKKCFTIKDTLRIHIRSYHSQTGKKKFQCDMCDKGFHHKAPYEMHYRLHTGIKPYQCKVCQKEFHRKDCYDRHTITHTDTKPHQCNICGKRFYVRNNLVQHIRTHTGEKPHQCNVCGKKFNARISLHMHNRIHTDEKPYMCDICKKYFYNSERLINHFRSHSDSDPLKCMVCKRNFIARDNYLKHVAKHEKEKRTESFTVIKNNKSKRNINDNDKKAKDNKNNQIKDTNKVIKSIKNDIDKENFSRKRTRSSHTQRNGHVVAQQAKRRRNI